MSEDYCEVRLDGNGVIGHVGPHPRMPGFWMAVWKPRNIHDCGMKRYKTRKGAENRVVREGRA